jgi:RimJ/RimL family protein N-acetyltransferase
VIEPPYLTDGVVAVRAWRDADLAATVVACDDPALGAWLPIPQPYTADVARHWLSVMVPEQWAGQERLPLAVADARDDTVLLGGIALRLTERHFAIGEISYWVAAAARGAGVAGRAARLVAGWAFADLGIARVEVLADVANAASRRVAEKAGFTREGVARSARALHGVRHDMVVYSLLPADLPPSRDGVHADRADRTDPADPADRADRAGGEVR